MIRVIIDTNNLPRNLSSPSAAFKRMVNLIQEGLISVLMPHIIAEEWRTQQLGHLRKQFQKAAEAIKDVLGGGHLDNYSEIGALTSAAAAIEYAAGKGQAISHEALNRLLQQLQAEVIPIAHEHGARVAAAYFNGSSPFSGVKSRKDFPDAFLYEAVSDLSRPDLADQAVVVVTADKNLATHLSTLPGTTCFPTLEQFVESKQVKLLTGKIAREATWRNQLPTVVASIKQCEDGLLGNAFINSFIDTLASREVEHSSIPSDNHDATVSMVGDPEDIEVQWDETEDYGPGVLRVPFTCTSEVLLDFYIFYADAYGQPDHISVQWADHENKPFFDAQAYATAEVKGFMSVTVSKWPECVDPETVEVKVDEITEIELNEDGVGDALR